MMRSVLLGIVAMLPMLAQEIPPAPTVEFRDLTWWSKRSDGVWAWMPGCEGTAWPHELGRIGEARILGPQKLVWEHRIHPIESVTTTGDGQVLVGFRLGTLAMQQLKGRRWMVTYTPTGASVPHGTFQTFSSVAGGGLADLPVP